MKTRLDQYTAAALCLLALCATPAAHAEVIEFEWKAAGAYEHQATLAPAKFVELCRPLEAGARVAWQFKADAPTAFNVHYHQGQDVIYPVKRAASRKAQGTLRAAVKQEYCWMWTNKTAAPLALGIKLQKG